MENHNFIAGQTHYKWSFSLANCDKLPWSKSACFLVGAWPPFENRLRPIRGCHPCRPRSLPSSRTDDADFLRLIGPRI